MPTDDDLIDRADTLIRRYRSFVARPTDTQPEQPDQSLPSKEDEIPLLTEIIDAHAIHRQNVEAILDALRSEVESEVSAWLVDVLPAAVANASQQILDELDAKARNTLLTRLQTLIDTQRGSANKPGEPGEQTS
jgi:hypothetical protein